MIKIVLLLPILALQFKTIYSQDGFATLGDGITGGAGGIAVSVCTENELLAAVTDDVPRIVRITCKIELTGEVKIGSNKSIFGSTDGAGVSGHGFSITAKKNVIIRGLIFCCAIAPSDGVRVENFSTNVWIDHNEFYSDLDHDKDYYDGLLDIRNGSDFVTVSWNKFHHHWKTSLIGSNDNSEETDRGRLHVTYHHNYFLNCYSRVPSLRFGTGHIYNNFYQNVEGSGINSRMGAEVLVESNVFRNVKRPISTNLDSREEGYAVYRNNDFGGSEIYVTQYGTFTNPPYRYRLDRMSKVPFLVQQRAGPLNFF